jgi:hypothetical protein
MVPEEKNPSDDTAALKDDAVARTPSRTAREPVRPAVAPGMVKVKFRVKQPPMNAGEVASYPAAEAEALIAAGIAEETSDDNPKATGTGGSLLPGIEYDQHGKPVAKVSGEVRSALGVEFENKTFSTNADGDEEIHTDARKVASVQGGERVVTDHAGRLLAAGEKTSDNPAIPPKPVATPVSPEVLAGHSLGMQAGQDAMDADLDKETRDERMRQARGGHRASAGRSEKERKSRTNDEK